MPDMIRKAWSEIRGIDGEDWLIIPFLAIVVYVGSTAVYLLK